LFLKIKLFSRGLKEELSSHPVLKILQQKNISEQQTALEKAKMLRVAIGV
jgi:cobalt-zinc-cadmium resistance protein CzcA